VNRVGSCVSRTAGLDFWRREKYLVPSDSQTPARSTESIQISAQYNIFYYINPNKMHMLQSIIYLTTALHVSGVTITHLQEHKTTVTTASGNRYTVIDRVNFTDKEYR